MDVTFLGAAREVTGSQHLVTTRHRRLLLDCGMFQGDPVETLLRNQSLLPGARELDAVVLSHAHVDHCGNLPLLYRAGYRGPVFGSRLTLELAELMLRDNLQIQSIANADRPPGFDPVRELQGIVGQFEPLDELEWHSLADDVRVRLLPAGHIPGASITELEMEEGGEWLRIVYTGDLGRTGMPLVADPMVSERCDLLICESTYGNRTHASLQQLELGLVAAIDQAREQGGRVLIPAFSLGRTQQLTFTLQRLFDRGQLAPLPVFVDSPLARRVTGVLERAIPELAAATAWPSAQWIHQVDTPQESRELQSTEGPLVVISASGMCDAGRIQHHLLQGIGDPRNTVLFVGFQAIGTLGRQLVDGATRVTIRDRDLPVSARVQRLDGFSSHADAVEITDWIASIGRAGGAGRICLVHGEPAAAADLASRIAEYSDEPVLIPDRGELIEV